MSATPGRVDLEDVAVYFSQEEWELLDEAQRLLYGHVMLENITFLSSRGRCQRAQDQVALSDEGGVLQTQSPRPGLCTQACNTCGPLLKDILHLAEQDGARLEWEVCTRVTSLSQGQKEQSRKELPWRDDQRPSFVTTCGVHMGEAALTCREPGNDFPAHSGPPQHQNPDRKGWPHGDTEAGALLQGDRVTADAVCGKATGQEHVLGEHQDGHTRAKPRKYGMSWKVCVTRVGRSQHQRVHAAWRPLDPLKCRGLLTPGSGFTKRQKLRARPTPYECSQCGKCVKDSSTLLSHQRGHMGEKPFKCSECGKFFRYSFTLKRNQRGPPRWRSG